MSPGYIETMPDLNLRVGNTIGSNRIRGMVFCQRRVITVNEGRP